jgi:hypothetical protein
MEISLKTKKRTSASLPSLVPDHYFPAHKKTKLKHSPHPLLTSNVELYLISLSQIPSLRGDYINAEETVPLQVSLLDALNHLAPEIYI